MPNFADQLGQQTATQAASSIFGIALGAYNDHRQLKQQQKLQKLQLEGNQQMTDYNYMKQLQMWKDTNYQAQMEQLKKANLNPGLIYGMSGGGGVTTGTPAGSVQGSAAPQGGREVQDMLGMGIQMQLLQAQKANIEADTENKKADTANKPIVGKNIEQQTQSAKAQQELTEVNTRIAQIEEEVKGKSQNMAIALIQTELRRATAAMEKLETEKEITKATKDDIIQKIHGEMLGIALHNELTRAQTHNTKTQTWATKKNVENEAYAIGQRATTELWNAESNAKNAAANRMRVINEISAETGLESDVIGNIIDALILKRILAPGEPKRNPIGYK